MAKSAAEPAAADALQAKAGTFEKKGTRQDAADKEGGDVPENGVPENLVEPTVRSKFADTAFWAGTVTTDEQGQAEISLDMPENLTTWKIMSWAMGHGTKVGQAEAEVITRKDLIVRLQAAAVLRAKGRGRPLRQRA